MFKEYGSLYFLLLLAVLGFVFFLLKRIRTAKLRKYKPKGPFLLSLGERQFFTALSNVVDKTMYICPKVRIADLVDVNVPITDRSFWSSFNKISQKHVDFVLCRLDDFSPLLVIELDGGSHNDKSKLLRDEFVNKVFDDAGIPILHIKASSFYEYKTLRASIEEKIKKIN